ncbi:GntR family transcriptional regulator [Paraclostridium benzoelyticum]|uniref:GntR family transcriptional regulator n=1 Tax=Paraclostridium benzoelyticum TaxID=1629550 RepID=A0A0M3DDC7_9FIRM|nr:GntR family transcriptional regulator [Paraclostridium benzoelyticum]KKY00660.1 GntR family transcriptional regulator [Paraclostridium benzoelyticum]OXX82535.1 GntR family transcriptional regulator [Paraclostridium benzoelyticum]
MNIIFDKVENDDIRPIREIVLHEIRNAIFEGKLNQGDRLIENHIAERMGVSRTPVREALRQLEIEGLAVNVPRKGTLVKGISKEDAIEIYDIREVLEGLVSRLACLHITRLEIRRLNEIISIMEESIKNSNNSEYIKAHNEYNQILLNASKNKRLIERLETIYDYLKSLRRISLMTNERREEAIKEHKDIVKAIEIGDEELAEKVARIHVYNAKKAFIKACEIKK